MILIPAIDIRNGNCVRLLQGDPEKETIYSDDPVDMALRFQDMGARLIHVVDLDGAFSGNPVNMPTVIRIAQSINIPIEIGGGIRSIDTISRYCDAGINRIILGTAIIDPGYEEIIDRFKEKIIAGIDAKDSMVATHGWKNVSSIMALDVIKELQKIGINEIIYTDIATDGMLTGPNMKALNEILSAMPNLSLIASGGVSSVDDIERLAVFSQRGLKGCIVGKAIYDGRIDLRSAIAKFS